MTGGEDSLSLALHVRRIKLHFHQLIHVLSHEHITVKLHNTVILDQTERCQLRPAVIESRIGRVVPAASGKQVLNPLTGDAACFERCMAGRGEGIGIKRYEGISRAMVLQRGVES